jgi:drug/metabolite transporter (DMT)-like permease
LNNKYYLSLPKPLIKLDLNSLAFIALFFAVIALSFAAIAIKFSEAEIGPSATIFNRLWIATLVLFIEQEIKTPQPAEISTSSVTAEQFGEKYREKVLLVLVAIFATGSILCWAWSLTQTSVTNSTVLRNLTPLFTSFGSWLVLQNQIDRRCWLGAIFATLGGITIAWGDWQLSSTQLIGDGVALLAAVLYAANLIAVGSLRDKLDTKTILLWRCSLGTLLILPFTLLTEDRLFPTSWQGWCAVIVLAIVCQILGQGLLVYSLKQFSAGFVSVFMLLRPIITALLAWIIFAEQLTISNLIALGLILTGIYLAKSSAVSLK